MDAPTHQTVKRIYLEARALDPEARAAFLDEACGDRSGLRGEVESLLAEDDGLDEFMNRPATLVLEADGGAGAEHEPLSHPERIGAYRILRPLGFGGMGVVYLAEQDSPRRKVALKLLRLDSASPRQVERFEHEAEVLGRMAHPNIAAVHEAGWADTETGRRPFFAMEYVEGRALLEYASENELDVQARIELVCRVAEAAHYAHERGILHRDLKPSNIMIDARGTPKVLDFGVARSMEADTRGTRTGQLVGTLSTMSPEQASGGVLDARSDVYSLGVVLYQLLTDRLPVVTDGIPLHEAVERIREQEPIAAGSVRRELKGDVETILGKALAKEPGRRYATAAELAEDLRLHLEQRPIRARRPTSLYVGWKLVRRHRTLAVSVLALFGVLAVTAFVSLRLVLRSQELERSEQQRQFYLQYGRSLRDLQALESLEHMAELHRQHNVQPEVLEAWLQEADALVAQLDAHRAELEDMRLREARGDLPGTPEEVQQLLETQAELVNRLEHMIGPRGTLPEVRAFLKARRARTPGGEE